MTNHFSLQRFWGLLIKEINQFRRDHTTFAMIIGIPIVQILIFGLAINTNPKHLPTALINYDNGPFSHSLIRALDNTAYFKFTYPNVSEKQAPDLIMTQNVLFVLTIPSDFSRKLVRGEHPSALLEADGTNPVAVAYALSAANGINDSVYEYDLIGPLKPLMLKQAPAQLITHVLYNPENITQYFMVPGLMGVILTMVLVMVTSMAITKEYERGTLESLLTTPALPSEVILAKVLPYIVVGYFQVIFIYLLATYFFNIPTRGSLPLLFILIMPFILANLFVGICFSTLVKSQLEASQVSLFFLLPSMLLSGFAFPFQGMPLWAQWIGNVLPMTHFVNITRGIMLKGSHIQQLWPDLWPILVFMFLMLYIALKRYRQTLD